MMLSEREIKAIHAALGDHTLHVHEALGESEPARFFVSTVPQESLDQPSLAAYDNLGIWNDKGLATKDVAEMIASIPALLADYEELQERVKSLEREKEPADAAVCTEGRDYERHDGAIWLIYPGEVIAYVDVEAKEIMQVRNPSECLKHPCMKDAPKDVRVAYEIAESATWPIWES